MLRGFFGNLISANFCHYCSNDVRTCKKYKTNDTIPRLGAKQLCQKVVAVDGIDITETRANTYKSLLFGLSESITFTSSTNPSNPTFSSKLSLTSILGILTTESRPYRLLVKGFQHTNVKERQVSAVSNLHTFISDSWSESEFCEIFHPVSD